MTIPAVAKALMAGCVGLLAVSTLRAQRAAAPPPRANAALVDMVVIAQSSEKFKKQLATLKAEMEASGVKFKKEADLGNQLTEKLRKLPPDSPERKDLEKQVLKMRADFELEGNRVNEEMHDKESKHIYAMTRDLKDELARFAEANGIPLVLRLDKSPPELNDPRLIRQEIQKTVVYQRDLDITPRILDVMNRRAGAPSTAARPAAPGKPAAR